MRTSSRRLAFDRRLLWSIITATVYREESVGLGSLSLDDDPAIDGRFVARVLNSNLGKASSSGLRGTEATRGILQTVFDGVGCQSTGLSVSEIESKAAVRECGGGGLEQGVGVGPRRPPNAEARGGRSGGNASTTQRQCDDNK